LRYGDNAYTDGVCYLLYNDLNHSGVISTCNALPKKDRHNDYGACEQGFSGFMDEVSSNFYFDVKKIFFST
jgi:hypothetical protein